MCNLPGSVFKRRFYAPSHEGHGSVHLLPAEPLPLEHTHCAGTSTSHRIGGARDSPRPKLRRSACSLGERLRGALIVRSGVSETARQLGASKCRGRLTTRPFLVGRTCDSRYYEPLGMLEH